MAAQTPPSSPRGGGASPSVEDVMGDVHRIIATHEPKAALDQLVALLHSERDRSRRLQGDLQRLRSAHAQIMVTAEQEEEYITNLLTKKLDQLKKEKEDLVLKVEQEEEYLTNTLQKRLNLLLREKGDLEVQLQQEEEYIVNSLQRQLQAVIDEKSKLERRLQEEKVSHVELEQLRTQMDELRNMLQHYYGERREYEKKNQDMRDELKQLKTENFVLAQKIKQEKEKSSAILQEKLHLERGAELVLERSFNEEKRRAGSPSGRHRTRSFSLPVHTVDPPSTTSPGSLSPRGDGSHPGQHPGSMSPPGITSPRGSEALAPSASGGPTTRRRRPSQGTVHPAPHTSPILSTNKPLRSGFLKYKSDTMNQHFFFILSEHGELAAFASDNVHDPNNFNLFTINMDTVTSISQHPDDAETIVVKTTNGRDNHLLRGKSVEDAAEWRKWLSMLSPLTNANSNNV